MNKNVTIHCDFLNDKYFKHFFKLRFLINTWKKYRFSYLINFSIKILNWIYDNIIIFFLRCSAHRRHQLLTYTKKEKKSLGNWEVFGLEFEQGGKMGLVQRANLCWKGRIELKILTYQFVLIRHVQSVNLMDQSTRQSVLPCFKKNKIK